MPIAYNESTGEALRLDDGGQWVKTIVSANPQTGEKLAFDGASWASVGKPKAEAPQAQEKKASYSEGFMASLNPLGLGDEVGAAGATVGQYLGNKINPVKMPFPSWSEAYDSNIAGERAKIAKFRDENPIAGYGGAILGSVGGAGAGAGAIGPSAAANSMSKVPVVGPKIAAMMAAPTAATMAGRAIQSGQTGAALGGLYGFTEGEGGVTDRLASAVPGALLGGAIGTAAAPAIELGVGAGQKLYRAFADKFGSSDSAAVRKMAEAMARDGKSASEVAATLRGNPNAAMMDAAGENMTGLASAAGSVPGPAKQAAQTFIDERMGGRGQRMLDAVGASDTPVIDLVDQLAASARQRSRPIYERSVNPSNIIAPAEFAPIAGDEFLAGVIKSVKADPLTGMKAMPDSALPVIDEAKKRIDDMIEAAKRSGENNRARLLTDKKDQLVGMADNAFPDYPAAREAWRAPMKVKEAMEYGSTIMKENPNVVSRAVAKMSPEESAAFRIGAKESISDLIATDYNAAANKFGENKGLFWKKLEQVFPDKAEFSAFKSAMENEIKMQRNERFVSSRVGSPTKIKDLAVEDMRNDPGAIIQGGKQLAGGDKLGGLMSIGRGVMDYVRRPSEAVASDLAGKMFTQDPAVNAATLKAMTERIRQYQLADQAKQSMANFGTRSGVVGSSGNNEGR